MSTRFRRSHFLYSDAAAVPASTGALSIFPQCRSSVYSPGAYSVSLHWAVPASAEAVFHLSDAAMVPLLQAISSIPSALINASFGGYQAPLWLLSHDNSILGEYSGSRLSAELGPLSPDREVPWTARQIRITFTQFIIYMCELVKYLCYWTVHFVSKVSVHNDVCLMNVPQML